jgi:hypothetical protein
MTRTYLLLWLAGCWLLAGCNEASLIEGVGPTQTLRLDLNKEFGKNTDLLLTITGGGESFQIPFSFGFTRVSTTSTQNQYTFYANTPTNFRWAYDTYIRRFKEGDDIFDSMFNAGGTNIFIQAIEQSGRYSYTYQFSPQLNEKNYAAFRYKGKNSTLYGWVSYTAKADRITLHQYAYSVNAALKVGQ